MPGQGRPLLPGPRSARLSGLPRSHLLYDQAADRGAVETLKTWRPGSYRWFPYPKVVGGYRLMTTVDVVDRVVLRVLAFRAANSTDPALSARVFGHRLDRPGSWSVGLPSKAWRRYLDHQLSSLMQHEWAYTCVSDLAGFYLAIDTDLLCTALRAQGVPVTVVAPIERLLCHWQNTGDLSGLPVGGETSSVLSNAYLLPVDRLLGAVARDYAIYGDDFAVFDGDLGPVELSSNFWTITSGLCRSRATCLRRWSSWTRARPMTTSRTKSLASIDAIEYLDDAMALEMTYQLWDEKVLPAPVPNMTEVRFVLGRLGRRRDPYAVSGLLGRHDLLQLEPKSAVSYLIDTVSANQEVAERLSAHLAMPPTPTTEALHLHVCRFLASADRTAAVGGLATRRRSGRARWVRHRSGPRPQADQEPIRRVHQADRAHRGGHRASGSGGWPSAAPSPTRSASGSPAPLELVR